MVKISVNFLTVFGRQKSRVAHKATAPAPQAENRAVEALPKRRPRRPISTFSAVCVSLSRFLLAFTEP